MELIHHIPVYDFTTDTTHAFQQQSKVVPLFQFSISFRHLVLFYVILRIKLLKFPRLLRLLNLLRFHLILTQFKVFQGKEDDYCTLALRQKFLKKQSTKLKFELRIEHKKITVSFDTVQKVLF